jgi:hypothetical protein
MNQQANFENNKLPQRISYLVNAYINGSITPEEHDELDTWVGSSDDNMHAFEELTGSAKDKSTEEGRKTYSRVWDELLHQLFRYSMKLS